MAQLSIMGWQMAAIKYEKDRADNTLLPNYNTYGRFDIPSYYESYWQSPESRYYTGPLAALSELILGALMLPQTFERPFLLRPHRRSRISTCLTS